VSQACIGADRRIGWSTLDQSSSPPRWVGAILTDRATSARPALAWFQDKLYMAWRGPLDDRNLFWATLDCAPGSRSRGLPAGSPGQSRLTEWPGPRLFHDTCTWLGAAPGDDQRLFWATFDGRGDWTPQEIAENRGSLRARGWLFFKTSSIWHGGVFRRSTAILAVFDEVARKWSEQRELNDRGSAQGPALVAFRDRLFMFWRGVADEDTRVFFSTFNGKEITLFGPIPRWWTRRFTRLTRRRWSFSAMSFTSRTVIRCWRLGW